MRDSSGSSMGRRWVVGVVDGSSMGRRWVVDGEVDEPVDVDAAAGCDFE
jgi:hypothetical protein